MEKRRSSDSDKIQERAEGKRSLRRLRERKRRKGIQRDTEEKVREKEEGLRLRNILESTYPDLGI